MRITIVVAVLCCLLLSAQTVKPNPAPQFDRSQHLTHRAQSLEAYAKRNHYNTDYFILVDMSLSSGQKRMYLWDANGDKPLKSGLIAHGHCKKNVLAVEFSNVPDSNCSSQGRYAISDKYTGQFGESYKLLGLDPTNSNAFDRFIVLHSHSCVSDSEQSFPICPSEGCPTLSPAMLDELKPLIDSTEKPILLWIFKSDDGWKA
jgi:hypothetical protein